MSVAVLAIVIFVIAFLVAPLFVPAAMFAKFIGLDRDGGFAELLSYGSAFIAAANFLIVYLIHRSRLLPFFSNLMAFIAIDDALRYHETAGKLISRTLGFPGRYGLRPQDFGELAAWAIVGTVFAILFLWSLRCTNHGDGGVVALGLAPFAVLVVCGVLFDLLHAIANENLGRASALVEDGRELIAVVVIAIYSVGLIRNADTYYRTCENAEFL